MQQMIRRSSLSCRRKVVSRLFLQLSSESGNDKDNNEMSASDVDNSNSPSKHGTAQRQGGGSGSGGGSSRGEEARGSAISFFRSRRTEGSANWIKGVKELLIPKKEGIENSSASSKQQQYRQQQQQKQHHSEEQSSGNDSAGVMNNKPAKIFNSRMKKTGGNRGGFGGGGRFNDENLFGDDNTDGSSGGGSNFSRSKSSRRSNKSEQDDNSSNDNYNPNAYESVPPNIMLHLFDVEALQHKIEDGLGIDTKGLDHGDEFIANVITQCLKNEDGVYREVITSKELFDNLRIPVARPAKSLLMSTIPDINEDPDSIGYKLGSTAWQVLSKNYYYSEAECKYMSQKIAKLTNKIMTMAQDPNLETDLIFNQYFRKGLAGIEYEERKLELLSEQPSEIFEQGETDWEQSAVVDEDDLFDDDDDVK